MDLVLPSEYLARYILDKSYYKPSDRTVRYNAFMPTPTGETSVFRISGLEETEIWKIGTSIVAQKRNKALLGRADIIHLMF